MWIVLLSIINCVVAKTIHYDSVLGDKCQTNKNCIGLVPNSMCFNNRCVCRLTYNSDGRFRCVYELRYRRQTEFGIRMLGEDCESNDECRRTPVDGAKICLLNQCQCSAGHVPIDAYRCIRDFEQLPSNTRIIKSSDTKEPPGYGSICLTNNDCQHSTVQLECLRGTCVCLEGYVPLGKYLCYNIHGEGAPMVQRSTVTFSPSTTAILMYNPPNDEGVKSLGKLGTTCTDDYYCRQSVSQSHCYNGKCSCIDGYISSDPYTCMEGTSQDLPTISVDGKSLLGGKCFTNRNCHTSDAVCSNNICTCPDRYFPIDDWNCLSDSGSLNEESIKTTTKVSTTTTGFDWWPWSTSSTTRQAAIDSKNTFPFRCLLNRQCASVDRNSHCTSYRRCVCNIGYKLEMTNNRQRCVGKIINDDNCD